MTKEDLIRDGYKVVSDEYRIDSSNSVSNSWKNGVYQDRDMSTRPSTYVRHRTHYPNKSNNGKGGVGLKDFWNNLDEVEKSLIYEKAKESRKMYWENLSDEDLYSHYKKCIPKHIDAVLSDGSRNVFRSSWEVTVAEWLIRNSIKNEYEPFAIKLPNGKRYIPDFYLSELGIILEVKPSYFVKDKVIYKYEYSSKVYKTLFITEHDIKRFDLETPEAILATTWFERTGVNA